MSTVVTDNVQDSGGSSLLGRRNAIINGNFGVNQRGVSGTVSLSAGEYGHDRWKAGASGATYTFSNSGGVTTIDISAGSLVQVVEDVNVVTDTYVLSWEGTAQGKIGGGSFGDSGVTESVTGGSNLNIEFNTGTVSKVQLEIGNKPTPFEHRSIGEELALCQRYFFKSYNDGVTPGTVTESGAYYRTVDAVTTFASPGPIRYAVTMRATPTITAYSPETGASGKITIAGDKNAVLTRIGAHGCGMFVDNDSDGIGVGSSCQVHITAEAEL